ncbi:molybdopterin molybdenumtransferase [Flexivirga endophytica]|uniref:Molybdopterin molybdenumtransferase n=1 Tax=Flexivirga endophytica TaxID=1849103 RepID=A0A916WZ73_9MICO|nr:gephyrin-like molybdotransferase Glp [Flexivirga endophytica]GGB44602.1 molybdopterin molybdenumtransferase [Flexivirga endophytica]GHB60498.1 molybdopterin molybdenumtransferase [Flexivirga endophytica]
MLTFDEYQQRVIAAVRSLPPRTVDAADAPALLGLVMAESVRTRRALPGFTNSAMDGYAVRAADVRQATVDAPVSLPVAGDIPAGDTRTLRLEPGTAWRIMTGAPLPDGADAVVQVELTDGGLDRVAIREAVDAGRAIRHRGEDVEPGDEVLPAGTLLRPRHVPALISSGVGEVSIIPRPRVAIVSTGDELVPPGQDPGHGQVVDSNAPMLAALATECGFEVTAVRRVGDTAEEVRDVLTELAEHVELIVTSGGVSAGAFEPLKLAFEGGDSFDFVKVAMQPGKPQGFGKLGSATVFALPGNPVSSLVSFLVFVAPAGRVLAGRDPTVHTVEAAVAETWTSPPGRQQFARVVFDDDGRVVRPIGGQGSHVLGGLAGSQALAVVPADTTDVAVGETLHVIPLEGLA